MSLNIEVQETLKTQSFKNLPKSLNQFLITANRKYLWLEPQCPYCGSYNVVHNGYYLCEHSYFVSLNLKIKQGHYLCKSCGKTFSTPFPLLKELENDLRKFLKETCFILYMNGMSFEDISGYISKHYNLAISDETVREYYRKIAKSFRSQNVSKTSGFYNIDCQHLKVRGEHIVRLAVIDLLTKLNIIDVDIPDETNEIIVERLRLLLLPYKIKGFIVDGKGGFLKELKKEFKVPIQRCIFHVQQLIVRDYIQKFGKNLTLLQLRNMYMLLNIFMNHEAEVNFLNNLIKDKHFMKDEKRLLEKWQDFRKDLKRFRRKQKLYLLQRTEEEMKENLKLAKLFLTEKHEIKRIKRIENEWEECTEFLRTKELAPTNNAIEHYFSKTLTKTEKKVFRTITALKEKISACRAIFNKWFKPTITLQEIFLKYAKIFLLFS